MDRPPAVQPSLRLEPRPEQLLEAAEALRLSRSYWRQRYRSLDELLADPKRAAMFLTCARRALLARWAKG